MKNSFRNVCRDALKFVALFAFCAGIAYVLLAFTPLSQLFSQIAALSSLFILQLIGVQAQLSFDNSVPHIITATSDAEINLVCAGILEIAVLFGIIFASFEKSLRSRLKGFAIGLLVLLVFNPLRIALSIKFVDPIVHDVLFRITLVAVLVSYYSVWYYWHNNK
ncbi:MAG: hypothetical protein V1811_02805 [Candidatus Micrarchaeota archaeon]